jgi:DNA repair exonuclease SbcCD ATPase subunit
MKALELIRTAARQTKSKALEQMAQELSAPLTGPVDEVNGLIEKMIFHLQAEQKDEDDHKNWCDLELNKTDASIIDKEEKIEELQAKIHEAQAYVTELTEAITENTEMVAKIDMHMKESAEIREVGKRENMEAIKDAQVAQTAIAEAIAVLETHYKETGMIKKESWEFVQQEDPVDLPKDPSTWDASYTGVMDPKDPGNGIVSVMEATSADFAKMEADTKVQEETDQKFYEEDKKDCEIEKATRLKDAEMKGEEKKRQVEKISVLDDEKKHVSGELETTQQYLADLQKACVEGTSTYEARKEARAKEIEALGAAQDILKDAFNQPVQVS